MNIIEQLIKLALNDKLAQCDIAGNQRVFESSAPVGYTRMTLTNDSDTLIINDRLYDYGYMFTCGIVKLTRALICGDENLTGFISLCEMLEERFDGHLSHEYKEYLSNRLKYLRTIDRLELNDTDDTVIHLEYADFNDLKTGEYHLRDGFTYDNGSVQFDDVLKGMNVIKMTFSNVVNVDHVSFSSNDPH